MNQKSVAREWVLSSCTKLGFFLVANALCILEKPLQQPIYLCRLTRSVLAWDSYLWNRDTHLDGCLIYLERRPSVLWQVHFPGETKTQNRLPGLQLLSHHRTKKHWLWLVYFQKTTSLGFLSFKAFTRGLPICPGHFAGWASWRWQKIFDGRFGHGSWIWFSRPKHTVQVIHKINLWQKA